MKTFYITFGQTHCHFVGDKMLDSNCVAGIDAPNINEAREIAFKTFGGKWSLIHDKMSKETLQEFYPRGIIKI